MIVDIKSTDENLGKDIAMHIAATKPKALIKVEFLKTLLTPKEGWQ